MNTAMPAKARLRFSVATYIALLIGLVYSLRMVWNNLASSKWETPAVLLALGILLSYDFCKKIYIRPTGPRGVMDSVYAWCILLLFFLLALAPMPIDNDFRIYLCFWLFLMAPLRFSSGGRVALLMAFPLFIFCVFLPMHSEILLAVSHPLRVIATTLSGFFLRMCGFDVSNSLTVLRIGKEELAVTDACSGIQQLEALLMLGYILAKCQQSRLRWMLIHYSFCIPAVIISNSIRLVTIVMLYRWPVGEAVLYSWWHEGLGYFQVLLAVMLMWLVGLLIAYANGPVKEEAK